MGTKGYTVFTNLEAANIKATGGFVGDLTGNVSGTLVGKARSRRRTARLPRRRERPFHFL
jgi:hypothetical protein